MGENYQKQKIAKRIVTYSEIYMNDFDSLMKLELPQLVKLQAKLLIGLRIKFAYKLRHKK